MDKITVAVSNAGSRIADKARAALADGKITPEEWAGIKVEAKDSAIVEIKSMLPQDYAGALQKAIDSGAVDAMIRYVVDHRQAAIRKEATTATEEAASKTARDTAIASGETDQAKLAQM